MDLKKFAIGLTTVRALDWKDAHLLSLTMPMEKKVKYKPVIYPTMFRYLIYLLNVSMYDTIVALPLMNHFFWYIFGYI